MSMNPYLEIYEQYFDNASFLWLLRSIAIDQPHYDKVSIKEIEKRIEAQLDGLLHSTEDSWPLCEAGLELEEPGEVFTASIIAFNSKDPAKIQKVVNTGLVNEQTTGALISAMVWLPGELIHSWVQKFLTSKALEHKYIALAVCGERRENPGEYLDNILARKDCRQHEKLYSRALHLIGEIQRKDLTQYLSDALNSENKNACFWASYSTVLVGQKSAVSELKPYVMQPGALQMKAIKLAFNVLPVELAREWISELSIIAEQERAVIIATGILGDPDAIDWLINRMRNPAFAKLSAEAFTLITGIELEPNQLIDHAPAVHVQDRTEIDDEEAALDEDENLPYPNPQLVQKIWKEQGENFVSGKRYFMGKPVTVDWVRNIRHTGNQRQRHLANLHLALLGDIPLCNTRAKTL